MYITFYKTAQNNAHQFSIEDWLNGVTEITPIAEGTAKRITAYKPNLRNFFAAHKQLSWYILPEAPAWPISEIGQHYHSFCIPKKSGGLRHIDAPDDELSDYLRKLKRYFENTLHILTHDAAHAYVKERSVITDIKVHQANESNWFLKIDLKDFFPSHNLDYVMGILHKIYPIGYLMEDPAYEAHLKRCLEYAFLNGVLPQGTPLSPTLTNICMIPLDYEIEHKLWSMRNGYVYTRYADDMTVSSRFNFSWTTVVDQIKEVLTNFNSPFRVKTEKTRYGSRSGRNWNFGIMLNKDNRMTIGHKRNQQFRAMLNNLIKDYKNGVIWTYEDRAHLSGLISYYKSIDPEYITTVIQRYEQKESVNIKRILNS